MTIVNDLMDWLFLKGAPWRPYLRSDAVARAVPRNTGRSSSRRPTAPLMRESLPSQRIDVASPPRHWLMATSRVAGARLLDKDRRHMGELRDLSIDKKSGRIVYALAVIGEETVARLHPLPWSLLKYDFEAEGYVFPLDAASITAAPSMKSGELEQFGLDDAWRGKLAKHYDAYVMPFYI